MSYRIASIRQREKIYLAAARLFSQKGYMATSLENIAKVSKCNKASIHYYFRTKSALLYEIATRSIQEVMGLASPVLDSDLPPVKKLKALVINHLEWEMTNAGFAGIRDTERKNLTPKQLRAYLKMRDEYEQIFRKVIEAGIVEKEFQTVDPNLISMFILGLMGSVMRWYKPGGKLTPNEIALKAWDLISQGLAKR